MEQTLTRFGFSRITRVDRLPAVLDMLGGQHVDLVILPVDALDESLLARLDRSIRMERHTAVLGTAPATEPELMLRAMRAGIQEFLVRPLQPTELAASLERLLRRSVSTSVEGQVYAVYSAKGGTAPARWPSMSPPPSPASTRRVGSPCATSSSPAVRRG